MIVKDLLQRESFNMAAFVINNPIQWSKRGLLSTDAED